MVSEQESVVRNTSAYRSIQLCAGKGILSAKCGRKSSWFPMSQKRDMGHPACQFVRNRLTLYRIVSMVTDPQVNKLAAMPRINERSCW